MQLRQAGCFGVVVDGKVFANISDNIFCADNMPRFQLLNYLAIEQE